MVLVSRLILCVCVCACVIMKIRFISECLLNLMN